MASQSVARDEHGQEIATGVDYSHTLYVQRLEKAVVAAKDYLQQINRNSLNHAGQTDADTLIGQALSALEVE